MKWLLFRWIWHLRSPLFIGAMPAGALNRCRLYIPARAMWGAITAEVARARIKAFPEYEKVGRELKVKVRFSYLYPAEYIAGKWGAWLPQYEKGKGLSWQRQASNDGTESLSDREFRSRLLDTRPGTAIDPQTYSAAEGTLRETECIQPYWRDRARHDYSPVAMVGYVFISGDCSLQNEIEKIDQLFVGGDTRYGLGQLQRVEWNKSEEIFGMVPLLDDVDSPVIEAERVLAHAMSKSEMQGAFEALAGWDRLSADSLSSIYREPLWAPGSTVSGNSKIKWSIQPDGIWKEHYENTY